MMLVEQVWLDSGCFLPLFYVLLIAVGEESMTYSSTRRSQLKHRHGQSRDQEVESRLVVLHGVAEYDMDVCM